MSEDAFTPGPWKLGRPWANGVTRFVQQDAAKLHFVAEARGDTAETRDANARLIAAAPDLLQVLERYVAAYPAFRIKPVGAPGSEKRIEQENLMALEDAARAAIAKARGEQ